MSSIVPPYFFIILIKFKSTLLAVYKSTTLFIAFKAMGANSVEFWDTILLAKLVFTHSINYSSSFTLTFSATSSTTLNAYNKAT